MSYRFAIIVKDAIELASFNTIFVTQMGEAICIQLFRAVFSALFSPTDARPVFGKILRLPELPYAPFSHVLLK